MSARKSLATFGRKRKPDYVRVIRESVEGAEKIRVLWKEGARLRTESFDDTRKGLAEAKAFAEGVHERLQTRAPAAIEPISIRDLFDKHLVAKESDWRPNTLRLLRWRWGKLELAVARSTPAHLITRETLDDLKKRLLASHSPNQVRLVIKAVTSVFRWGVDRDLIPPTKVITYRFTLSKDTERSAPKMAEYSADERAKVLAQLDPRDSRGWRVWVAVTLLAYCGPRQNAALHLEWDDVDLEANTLRWRPEKDKMANDRVQPMPAPVVDAMWVAYGWRLAYGYTGRYVFFRPGAGARNPNPSFRSPGRALRRSSAKADRPWTYSALNGALHDAEDAAGIPKVKYKAAHAFRRGVAGDIHAITGSSKAAADWIGDKSVKVVEKHYILEREEELRKTATLVGGEPESYETQRDAVKGAPEDS